MADMDVEPCQCGWPKQVDSEYCETCDAAPYEHEDRPWYTPFNEWNERYDD